jgi:twitching motility protein PilT
MVPNVAIRNLIREDKVHQIYSQMQVGQNRYGMVTLNQNLLILVQKRQIAVEEALGRTSELDELRTMLVNAGISMSGPAPAPPTRQRP